MMQTTPGAAESPIPPVSTATEAWAVPSTPQQPMRPEDAESDAIGSGPAADQTDPVAAEPEPSAPPEAEHEQQEPEPKATPLLLADHSSTDEDRRSFRSSLGWRYDAATQMVSRMLAERPGMRSAAPKGDVLMTELAAVQVFASSGQVDVVEAFRTGNDLADRAYLSCIASGLRWLPSLQGVVVRGGPSDPAEVDDYVVGAKLLEPAPVVAKADAETVVPGAVEVLIWSITARRLAGLVEGERQADVAFAPSTTFEVVAVDRGSTRSRVLLTEVPPGWNGTGDNAERRAARIRKKLEDAAAAREDLRTDESAADDEERFAALPGMPASPVAVSTGGTS